MKKYVLLTLGMMVCAPLAWAAPVTFIYNSTTDASAAGGPVSEPVSVTFTFDSNLVNGTGDFSIDSQHGSYGSWSGILTLGNQTVSLAGGTILLWNDITAYYANGTTQTSDGYDFRWDNSGPPSSSITSLGTLFGQQLSFFRILIVDNSATMFSSNALPTNPSFAPKTDYFIQDEYDLANGTILGTTEFNPPGRPYSLKFGTQLTFAVQYWDGRGAANDGRITGGSGTWNATATNWTDAAGAANGKWLGGGAAIFGGTAGTVTLGGPILASSLTFQTDGYVISGSSALTLAGSVPMLTMDGGATIAAPIAGTNGLTENGPGKLTFSSASNRYIGGTTVAGALQIGTTSAVGSIGSGPIAINDGATLTVVNTTGNRLSDNVSNGAGGLGTLVVTSANTNTISGMLTDGGAGQLALLQNGSGTTILTNAGNTYSGATRVTRGVLQVGNASAAGTIGSDSAVCVSGGGTLKLMKVAGNNFTNDIADGIGGTGTVILDPVASLTVSGVIRGSGGVLAMANPSSVIPVPMGGTPAPIILTGANTYTGATTVSSGILQIGDGFSGSLAADSLVTVNRTGTLALNLAESGTLTNNVTNNGQMALLGANEETVSGIIVGTGSVTRTGSGVTTLTGANTYTGGTTISGGALLVKNQTGSATGEGPVTVNAGGVLGGNGAIGGNVILNKGGDIFPAATTSEEPESLFEFGAPGNILHLGAMTWNGGGALSFAVGFGSADEIMLSGALTKGSAGPWDIYVDPDFIGETPATYTLLTFSSTNFTLANFNLKLPLLTSGTLVETKTSLLLEDVKGVVPPFLGSDGTSTNGVLGAGIGAGFFGDGEITVAPLASEIGSRGELPVINAVPEPGSIMLLVFGGGAVLGWRRRW